MQYTTLGKTGLEVSRLGFGCMRLPMADGRVIRELAIPMLHRAKALGVNYFDTAIGYCNQDSQRCLGEAMAGMRDEVIISTKNNHYNKKDERGWWTHLENSLERLRTDYIDVYNFHGLRWRTYVDHVEGTDGQIAWMLRAKEEGMIRHIAFSFHDTAENLMKLASTGHFDAVTLQYNILDQSNEEAFEHVVETCGLGITVMGPVGGGRLGGASDEIRKMLQDAKSVPEVALRFVLSNPYISIALSGMDAMPQVEENARVAARKSPVTAAEQERVNDILENFRKLSDLYCTGCDYCMPCPSGIDISGNFMAFNTKHVYGLETPARSAYGRLRGGRAIHCMACGKCEPKCPQNIEIVRQLQETVRSLDDAYGRVVARVKPTSVRSFERSGKHWSAEINGRIEVRNLSDQPVVAKIGFGEGASVRPAAGKLDLDAFEVASQRVLIRHTDTVGNSLINTAASVTGGETVDLMDAAFFAAFAGPAPSAGTKVPRSAITVELANEGQLATGSKQALASHGASCRFAYDDDNLYLSARVRDDLAGGRRDLLALYLDARKPALLGRNSPDPKLFRIDFPAPTEDGPKVRIADPRGLDARGITCRTRRTGDGYSVSAVIPFALLGLGQRLKRHLGLEVGLESHDRRGRPQVQMFWTGSRSAGRPDRFGHLFLTA